MKFEIPQNATPEQIKVITEFNQFIQQLTNLVTDRTSERDQCIEALFDIALPALNHAANIIREHRLSPGPAVQEEAIIRIKKLLKLDE